jgi:hypothetical protein
LPAACAAIPETDPRAELIDDQPVFHQAAVLKSKARIGFAEPCLRQESTSQGAIGQNLHVSPRAPRAERARGAPVEHRILNLRRNHVEARIAEAVHHRCIPIRRAQIGDLATLLTALENVERLDRITNAHVPPEELYQRNALDLQPLQRAINDGFDLVGADVRQAAEIRNQLGVHDNLIGNFRPATAAHISDELADHLFNAGVNVRAIERGDAGVQERFHIGDGLVRLHLAVIASELPPALDHPRNRVPGTQLSGFNTHSWLSRPWLSRIWRSFQ